MKWFCRFPGSWPALVCASTGSDATEDMPTPAVLTADTRRRYVWPACRPETWSTIIQNQVTSLSKLWCMGLDANLTNMNWTETLFKARHCRFVMFEILVYFASMACLISDQQDENIQNTHLSVYFITLWPGFTDRA